MFEDRTERWGTFLIIVSLAAAGIYITSVISPPSLMDDVDSVQAQIARNMLSSGDWVTPRIDGVVYFEKSPLVYWLIAIAYRVLGVHDWAARVPIALSAVGLSLLTASFGNWAFGKKAGFYAGLVMATCLGLWLFTRILIPDVMLTFTVTLAMWAFLRVLDDEEEHPLNWALTFSVSLALGSLLKSLIAVVFPIAAGFLYLVLTRQIFVAKIWKRLCPLPAVAVFILIAAPWHILAAIRNPPYFAWTLKSAPGHYHGFLWFYIINEQLLRFLNLRYPRDYNTVPRLWFWLFHLLWLFPWSVYFPAVAKLSFRPLDRGGRTRLLAVCWSGFVLFFFTFSTTQEYYSMPCYPALALLLGCAMASGGERVRSGTRMLAVACGLAAVTSVSILIYVWRLPTPGDISAALASHPKAYSLSLGHMEDLTLNSFAYLRLPLGIAAVAFLAGTLNAFLSVPRAYLASALMMIVFFQGARIAMIRFDPLLSSYDLVRPILSSQSGEIILDHHYYTFSSVPFYTGATRVLLLNGRWNNFEYGSNAPGAADVFIDDWRLQALWLQPRRWYLIAKTDQLPRLDQLLGSNNISIIRSSGGKTLITNDSSQPSADK